MAAAKTDTGELFLSRLSETYVCRPGENVLLECYVRHDRVKAIVWYANGEKVEERGFRLWHQYKPKTGQCVLYLRSVLYSDEGLYCCEAMSHDNLVETLEIRLTIVNCKLSQTFIFRRHRSYLPDDKSWTRIPVLHMAGRVTPEREYCCAIRSTVYVSQRRMLTLEKDMPMHFTSAQANRR
jgi:hypothetical protein